MSETRPIEHHGNNTAPMVMIEPTYQDPISKALYVHRDLELRQGPWAEEQHISPMEAMEQFGDVESWVSYVRRYSDPLAPNATFLTWSKQGLTAILDYAISNGEPNRCQWGARHPFVNSHQWTAWMALCGRPLGQRQAIESLEDLAEDIVKPAASDLATILRTLRATVKSKADTELRPDGTVSIAFSKDAALKSGAEGSVDLPSAFTIAIPALKGHTDGAGVPILYSIEVRVRASVDDDARLAFRLSIPTAERILEDAYADRVATAKALLGESLPLLRAAD